MLRDILKRDAVAVHQFIKRRQGRRQLRTGNNLGLPGRDERMRAARIRAVLETQLLHQPQRMPVHLPACRRMGLRRLAEYPGIAVHRKL